MTATTDTNATTASNATTGTNAARLTHDDETPYIIRRARSSDIDAVQAIVEPLVQQRILLGKDAVVFYEATVVGGTLPVAAWTVVPYTPAPSGAQPRIKFANYEQQSAEVYNTGILLGIKPPTDDDGWVQLVSTMNAVNMPPPGASGSPFVPLTTAPPSILKPEKPGKGALQTLGRSVLSRACTRYHPPPAPSEVSQWPRTPEHR